MSVDLSVHSAGFIQPVGCVEALWAAGKLRQKLRCVEIDIRVIVENNNPVFYVHHDKMKRRSARRLLTDYLIEFFDTLYCMNFTNEGKSIPMYPYKDISLEHIVLNLKDQQYVVNLCSYISDFLATDAHVALIPASFYFFVVETDSVFELPPHIRRYVRTSVTVTLPGEMSTALESETVAFVRCGNLKKMFGEPRLGKNHLHKKVCQFIIDVNAHHKKPIINLFSSVLDGEAKYKTALLLPDMYINNAWSQMMDKIELYVPTVPKNCTVGLSFEFNIYYFHFIVSLSNSANKKFEAQLCEDIKSEKHGFLGTEELKHLYNLLQKKVAAQEMSRTASIPPIPSRRPPPPPVSVPSQASDPSSPPPPPAQPPQPSPLDTEKYGIIMENTSRMIRNMDRDMDLLNAEIDEAMALNKTE